MSDRALPSESTLGVAGPCPFSLLPFPVRYPSRGSSRTAAHRTSLPPACRTSDLPPPLASGSGHGTCSVRYDDLCRSAHVSTSTLKRTLKTLVHKKLL